MKSVDRNSARILCFAAVITLAGATIFAGRSPGFITAIATVGAATCLPLERIASDDPLAADTTHESIAPRGQAAVGRHTTVRLDTSKLTPLRTGSDLKLQRGSPGYRRTITDSKYWT